MNRRPASLSVSQFTDRWDSDVQNAVFTANLLTQAVHALAGLPHDLGITDAFRSPVSRFLEFLHHVRRQDAFDGLHTAIVPTELNMSIERAKVQAVLRQAATASAGRLGTWSIGGNRAYSGPLTADLATWGSASC